MNPRKCVLARLCPFIQARSENKSRLEFGVGDVLEDTYDFAYQERVTLEVTGNPQWNGDDSRLKLIYDETAAVFRVKYPVRIHEQRLGAFTHTLTPENTTHTAAVDVGAKYSERIAELQAELLDEQCSSRRIRRLCDERTRKRDHSRNAAVNYAAEWLLERNVETVDAGDLTDVLSSHRPASVNQKTNAFRSHGQLTDRLELTFEDVGPSVEEVSEADSSSECPECGSGDVHRDVDVFRCHEFDLDAHSDVAGAWNLLQSEELIARLAALSAERDRHTSHAGAYWQWNEHGWTPAGFGEHSWSLDQPSVSGPAGSQPG